MKVAVVYNRDSRSVINLFGQPNLEKIGLKSIKRITDALKQHGHQTVALEGDKDLISRLEEFMPRVVKGERPGMVFNVSYGIQGQARYTHVPSILEMVGIPYVGSGPLAHSIALDKVVAKMILVQNGLPTPGFAVLQGRDFDPPGLAYPLIVKPKNEAVSFGLKVVRSDEELRDAAIAIFDRFEQDVLVERFIEGREVNVGLLGNGPPETLPPVELAFGEGEQIYSYEDKTGKSGRVITLHCPAPIGDELTEQATSLARRAFSAIGCYDCARVDMRLDANDKLYILEINSLPSLGERGSFVRAAREVGLDFPALVARLVEVASARYFGTPSPPDVTRRSSDPSQKVFSYITERRDHIEKRLGEWTRKPSRTGDPVGLRRVCRDLERTLTELKLKPVQDLTDARSVYTWETRKGMENGTLIVLHADVPIVRDMATEPFRREPEWLFGEGIGTSRAPILATEAALRALRSTRSLHSRRIGLLYYLDEGRDSRYSADMIHKAMSRCKRALVMRPGGQSGTVFVRRRGQKRYRLEIEGEPLRPGQVSKRAQALTWFASKLDDISALSSRKERKSVSVVEVRSQEFPMRLPHRVVATLLVNYADTKTAEQLEESVRKILGRGGPKWQLELVSERPPMKERRGSRRLARALSRVADDWEIPMKNEGSLWPSVAGLAPARTEVVCGLAPIAKDLYTPHEAVQRISLIQRSLLLAQYLLKNAE